METASGDSWRQGLQRCWVRSPKVYYRDTGLLHYFAGVRTAEDLDVCPARGTSWEAFIIDEIVSACRRHDPAAEPWFWRTARGVEVDLLIETGGRLIPFEITLHSAPVADAAQGVRACMADLGLARGYVVYPGPERYSLGGGVTALPADHLLAHPSRIATL